jgi:hypothetical protein
MNLARGSLPRLFAAALLAPVVPLILGLAWAAVWSTLTSQQIFGQMPPWDGLILFWLAIAAATAAFSLVLRALKKTRLRHHLLFALAIGAIPVVITLAVWIARMISAADGPKLTEDGFAVIDNPYGFCYELLFRRGTLNLQVTLAMWASVMAAVTKWMIYGFDRDSPTTTRWKIAGVAYVLALVVDFLGTFGQMSGAYPGWSDLLSKLCA